MQSNIIQVISLVISLLFLQIWFPYVAYGTNLRNYTSKDITPKSNILFILGLSSHSHHTAIEPLAHELVKRGDNVTFLTPVKPTKPKPKFHEVSTKSVDEFYNQLLIHYSDGHFFSRLQDRNINSFPAPLMRAGYNVMAAELFFHSPELKPWVESSNFDLVIIDNLANHFGFAIAYRFNAQVILSSPAGFWGYEEEMFGIPAENYWLPSYFQTNPFTEEITLYDKLYTILYPLVDKAVFKWWAYPKIDELARRTLDIPKMPSITQLERETSLLFTNQHFSNDYARPLPPLVVQLGGMHCEKANECMRKLKLEEFIAEADDFVLISFGSLIRMSKTPDHFLQILFDAIKSFKLRFILKWDADVPKNVPSNVFLVKWFPQQDILAHPKIKGFVTHGGLMSVQQAVCHGVPMIVIPVFSDQPYNAKTVSRNKIGIHLELSELTVEILKEAISQISKDKQYSNNVKKVSQLFKDRPMSALDTAVYWTEYVLRHKNTSHLKPLAMHQSWWEKRLLDVWLVLLSTVFIIVIIVYKTFKFIIQFSITKFWSAKLKHD